MSEKLDQLGFAAYFTDTTPDPDTVARVVIVDRGVYTIRTAAGEKIAKLAGRLLHKTRDKSERPCVGDWVSIAHVDDELAVINEVLPRRSFLRRKRAGKYIDYQMIAANIDTVFLMQSCQYDFNVRRLERYLVIVAEGNVEPIIVLTKIDLVSDEELAGMIAEIRRAGITAPIISTSSKEDIAVSTIREKLEPSKTYCLVGSSGVGKTTLLNALFEEDILATGATKESGEGRHTTVRRQLVTLPNGAMIIDTPGMRELGVMGAQDEIEDSFMNIKLIAADCKFSDCSHLNEPGCAVQEALAAGEIEQGQFDNYQELKAESGSNRALYESRRK